jgi:stage II sporulation protein D
MTSRTCTSEVTPTQFQQWMHQMLLRSKRSWWMTLLLWVVAIAPAVALDMRVAITENTNSVQVGGSTNAILRDAANNQVLSTIPANNSVMAQADSNLVKVNNLRGGGFWIEPQEGGLVYIGEKWYRGKVLVVPGENGITAINHVELEQYLYSVVGSETPASWNKEALKAQAVAARTYALHKRRPGAPFDVYSSTRSQAYAGIESEASTTRAAVESTRGQVVTYNGQMIDAAFHSCAGGRTENSEDIWTNALPYLRSVLSPDANVEACNPWTKEITVADIQKKFPELGTVLGMDNIKRVTSGRVIELTIRGSKASKTMKGSAFSSALGLKTAPFEIAIRPQEARGAGNAAPLPASFIMKGRGFGHGVGMSQWGAQVLASQQRWNYGQILLHYYTGTELRQISVQ